MPPFWETSEYMTVDGAVAAAEVIMFVLSLRLVRSLSDFPFVRECVCVCLMLLSVVAHKRGGQ